MSDNASTPIELGFAEFVAKLISDVFDATINSQLEQQEKLQELQAMLSQSDDGFVEVLLSRTDFIEQVDLLLQGYFPSKKDDELHAIYEGAPYQPGKGDEPEQPAVFEKLALKLAEGDFKPRNKSLTEQGVMAIYRAAAKPLAAQKRGLLIQMIESGFPGIVVDSGKINAKLTFNTTQLSQNNQAENTGTEGNNSTVASAGAGANNSLSSLSSERLSRVNLSSRFSERISSRMVTPIQPLNRYVGLIKPNINDQVRLTVKQASNKSPQDTQATTNIYSEVEIHFKTIK